MLPHTKSRTLILDSSQIASGTLSDCTFNLREVYSNVENVSLVGAIFADSQYIINTNNQIIIVNRSGTDYSFTLTAGNYTPTALATELQTRLNTNVFGGVFTISASSSTNKFTLACTVAVIYKFALNASLGRIFGFGSTSTSATTSVASTNQWQVNNTRFYRVLIHELICDFDAPKQYTFILPNNVNSGQFNYLTSANSFQTETISARQPFKKLSVKIYDEDNFLVEFNGVPWLLTLKIGMLNFI